MTPEEESLTKEVTDVINLKELATDYEKNFFFYLTVFNYLIFLGSYNSIIFENFAVIIFS